MAREFVISARLQIQPPNNINQLRNDIQSKLNGINANVNVNLRGADQLNQLRRGLQDTASSAKSASVGIASLAEQLAATTRRTAVFLVAAEGLVKLKNATTEAIEAAVAYQKELVRLKQVGGDSSAVINDISDAVTKLSTNLGASSADLIKASVTLRQAGISAGETKVLLEGLAKTTLTPTFESIDQTTEGLIALRQQFNLFGEEAVQALGKINTVSAQYAVESSDLITAIQKAGGAFKSAGGNFEEFLGIITSIRSTTRESADTIATGLRTVFARLQRPESVEALKNLGINLQHTAEDAKAAGSAIEGQFVGPLEAALRLQKGLTNVPTNSPLFATVVELIGGNRQVSKVIPLIQQAQKAREAYQIAQKSGTSLDRDAITAQESLANHVDRVKESFLDLFRTLGNNPFLQSTLKQVLDLTAQFFQLAKAIEPIIPLIVTLGAIKGISTISNAFSFIRQNAGATRTVTQAAPAPSVPTRKFAMGGFVGGYGDTDSENLTVPVGSYVLRKKAVKALGGAVKHLISDNYTPSGASQNVPIMAMPGEVIVMPDKARQIGYHRLEELNHFEKLTPQQKLAHKIKLSGGMSAMYPKGFGYAMGGAVMDEPHYASGGHTSLFDINDRKIVNNFIKNITTERGIQFSDFYDKYRQNLPLQGNKRHLFNEIYASQSFGARDKSVLNKSTDIFARHQDAGVTDAAQYEDLLRPLGQNIPNRIKLLNNVFAGKSVTTPKLGVYLKSLESPDFFPIDRHVIASDLDIKHAAQIKISQGTRDRLGNLLVKASSKVGLSPQQAQASIFAGRSKFLPKIDDTISILDKLRGYHFGGSIPKFASGGKIRPFNTRFNEYLAKVARFEKKAPTTKPSVENVDADLVPQLYPRPKPKTALPQIPKLSKDAVAEFFDIAKKGVKPEEFSLRGGPGVFDSGKPLRKSVARLPLDSSVPEFGITKFRKIFGRKPQVPLDEPDFTSVLKGLLPPGVSPYEDETALNIPPAPKSPSPKTLRPRLFGEYLTGRSRFDVHGNEVVDNRLGKIFYGRLDESGNRRIYRPKFAPGGYINQNQIMKFAAGGKIHPSFFSGQFERLGIPNIKVENVIRNIYQDKHYTAGSRDLGTFDAESQSILSSPYTPVVYHEIAHGFDFVSGIHQGLPFGVTSANIKNHPFNKIANASPTIRDRVNKDYSHLQFFGSPDEDKLEQERFANSFESYISHKLVGTGRPDLQIYNHSQFSKGLDFNGSESKNLFYLIENEAIPHIQSISQSNNVYPFSKSSRRSLTRLLKTRSRKFATGGAVGTGIAQGIFDKYGLSNINPYNTTSNIYKFYGTLDPRNTNRLGEFNTHTGNVLLSGHADDDTLIHEIGHSLDFVSARKNASRKYYSSEVQGSPYQKISSAFIEAHPRRLEQLSSVYPPDQIPTEGFAFAFSQYAQGINKHLPYNKKVFDLFDEHLPEITSASDEKYSYLPFKKYIPDSRLEEARFLKQRRRTVRGLFGDSVKPFQKFARGGKIFGSTNTNASVLQNQLAKIGAPNINVKNVARKLFVAPNVNVEGEALDGFFYPDAQTIAAKPKFAYQAHELTHAIDYAAGGNQFASDKHGTIFNRLGRAGTKVYKSQIAGAAYDESQFNREGVARSFEHFVRNKGVPQTPKEKGIYNLIRKELIPTFQAVTSTNQIQQFAKSHEDRPELANIIKSIRSNNPVKKFATGGPVRYAKGDRVLGSVPPSQRSYNRKPSLLDKITSHPRFKNIKDLAEDVKSTSAYKVYTNTDASYLIGDAPFAGAILAELGVKKAVKAFKNTDAMKTYKNLDPSIKSYTGVTPFAGAGVLELIAKKIRGKSIGGFIQAYARGGRVNDIRNYITTYLGRAATNDDITKYLAGSNFYQEIFDKSGKVNNLKGISDIDAAKKYIEEQIQLDILQPPTRNNPLVSNPARTNRRRSQILTPASNLPTSDVENLPIPLSFVNQRNKPQIQKFPTVAPDINASVINNSIPLTSIPNAPSVANRVPVAPTNLPNLNSIQPFGPGNRPSQKRPVANVTNTLFPDLLNFVRPYGDRQHTRKDFFGQLSERHADANIFASQLEDLDLQHLAQGTNPIGDARLLFNQPSPQKLIPKNPLVRPLTDSDVLNVAGTNGPADINSLLTRRDKFKIGLRNAFPTFSRIFRDRLDDNNELTGLGALRKPKIAIRAFGNAANALSLPAIIGSGFIQNTDKNRGNAGLQGALQFGGIGSQTGALFGPLGAGVGAIAGAAAGAALSLKEFDKQLKEQKVAESIEKFSDSLGKLNLNNGASLSGQIKEVRANIAAENPTLAQSGLGIGENIRAQAINLQSHFNNSFKNFDVSAPFSSAARFFVGGDHHEGEDTIAKERSDAQRQAIKQQLGAQLPGLTEFGNKLAGEAKNIDEFKRGAQGFGAELISLIADIRGISAKEVSDEFKDLIKETQKNKDAVKRAENAYSSISTQVSTFNRLTTAINAATINLEKFDHQLDAVSTLNGSVAPSRTNQFSRGTELFGTASAASFNKSVDFVTSAAGKNPLTTQLSDTAKGLNQAFGSIPSILQELIANPAGSDETLAPRFREGLEKSNPNVPKNIVSQLTTVFAAIKPDDFFKEAKSDITKFSHDLADKAFPSVLKVLQDSSRLLEDNLNKLAEDFAHGHDLINQNIGAGHLFETNRLSETRNAAENVARYSGRTNNPIDFLPLQTLNEPFNFRQRALTGFAGDEDANNPAKIGEQLRSTLGNIETETARRGTLSNFNEIQDSTKKLTDLRASAQRLQKALENLTNASEKNAGAQEKLSHLQAERESREGFVEQFIKAGPQGRFQLNQLAATTQIAATSPAGLKALPVGLQGQTLSFIQSLGKSFLPGLGLHADDLAKNLIKQFGGAITNNPASEGEELNLRQVIAEGHKAATDAAQELEKTFGGQTNKFFSQLDKNQAQFLSDLKKQLDAAFAADKVAQRQTLVNQVNEAGKPVQSLENLRKQGLVGANDDVSVIRKLSTSQDLDKFATFRNRIGNLDDARKKAASFDIQGSTQQEIVAGLAGQATREGGGDRVGIESSINEQINKEFEKTQKPLSTARQIANIGLKTVGIGSIIPGLTESIDRLAFGEPNRDEFTKNLPPEKLRSFTQKAISGNLSDTTNEFGAIRSRVRKETGATDEQLNNFTNSDKFKQNQLDASKIVTALNSNFLDAGDSAKKLVEAFNIAKARLDQNSNPDFVGPPNIGSHSEGGVIYRDSGGLASGGPVGGKRPRFIPRGTDTIPAMLSPDEYVVNAKSSRKYRSMLESINDDTIYRAEGGFVGNLYNNYAEPLIKNYPYAAFKTLVQGRDNIRFGLSGGIGGNPSLYRTFHEVNNLNISNVSGVKQLGSDINQFRTDILNQNIHNKFSNRILNNRVQTSLAGIQKRTNTLAYRHALSLNTDAQAIQQANRSKQQEYLEKLRAENDARQARLDEFNRKRLAHLRSFDNSTNDLASSSSAPSQTIDNTLPYNQPRNTSLKERFQDSIAVTLRRQQSRRRRNANRSILMFNSGGIVPHYLNNGGDILNSGPDKIPAMLTPDEHVINAKSARKYRPILDRINNDTLYRAEGGSVGNFYTNKVEPLIRNYPYAAFQKFAKNRDAISFGLNGGVGGSPSLRRLFEENKNLNLSNEAGVKQLSSDVNQHRTDIINSSIANKVSNRRLTKQVQSAVSNADASFNATPARRARTANAELQLFLGANQKQQSKALTTQRAENEARSVRNFQFQNQRQQRNPNLFGPQGEDLSIATGGAQITPSGVVQTTPQKQVVADQNAQQFFGRKPLEIGPITEDEKQQSANASRAQELIKRQTSLDENNQRKALGGVLPPDQTPAPADFSESIRNTAQRQRNRRDAQNQGQALQNVRAAQSRFQVGQQDFLQAAQFLDPQTAQKFGQKLGFVDKQGQLINHTEAAPGLQSRGTNAVNFNTSPNGANNVGISREIINIFQKSAEVVNAGFKSFAEISAPLIKAISEFNQSATLLSKEGIRLNITRNGKIDININGVEILSRIKDDMEKEIRNQIADAIKRYDSDKTNNG